MSTTRHCIVSGRVQGVFYRASCRREALARGLSGWVRNLSDGRVEVTACGEDRELEDFCRWLWQGPPDARVTKVVCEEVDDARELGGFVIR